MRRRLRRVRRGREGDGKKSLSSARWTRKNEEERREPLGRARKTERRIRREKQKEKERERE